MFLKNESLSNEYCAFRHFISNPGLHEMIVSDLEESKKPEYGIALDYIEEAKISLIDDLFRLGIFDTKKPIVIVSSPASRTLGSTNELKHILSFFHIISEDLRERYFGTLDMQSTKNYKKVWKHDAMNPAHKRFGVESVLEVQARMTNVIRRMERLYRNSIIILSGHGDPLQILETSFRGMEPSRHRELPPLQNAELRPLNDR